MFIPVVVFSALLIIIFISWTELGFISFRVEFVSLYKVLIFFFVVVVLFCFLTGALEHSCFK